MGVYIFYNPLVYYLGINTGCYYSSLSKLCFRKVRGELENEYRLLSA
jgi:hypothetical protein